MANTTYFLWGVIAYSALLTVIFFYKEFSDYYSTDAIDAIIAGPVCWISVLVYFIVVFIRSAFKIQRKKKPYKNKSKKYIQKVVRKIMRNYKRYEKNKSYYVDLRSCCCSYQQNDIKGYGHLAVPKPINERINKKFSDLMYHQWKDTYDELMNYFELVTEERMRQDGKSEYFIEGY